MTDLAPFAFQLLIVLILIPVERSIPRAPALRPDARHLATVLFLGALAFLAGLLLTKTVSPNLIRVLAPFQVISIAHLPIPTLLGWVIGLLVLDYAAYLSHVLFHRVPALWALHSVHHSDQQVTGATGLFHHPLETLANALLLLAVCVLFGLPVAVIAAYGLLSLAVAILTHANIAIPRSIDRGLRRILVTPDMHRIHHSVDLREGNSNFGQTFPFWDWLCGTYLDHPAAGETRLVTGLPAMQQPATFSAYALLAHPFRRWRPL